MRNFFMLLFVLFTTALAAKSKQSYKFKCDIVSHDSSFYQPKHSKAGFEFRFDGYYYLSTPFGSEPVWISSRKDTYGQATLRYFPKIFESKTTIAIAHKYFRIELTKNGSKKLHGYADLTSPNEETKKFGKVRYQLSCHFLNR